MNVDENKLVDCCPMGHRIRGPLNMRGKWVNCPKCQAGFEFGSPKEPERSMEDGSRSPDAFGQATVAAEPVPVASSVTDTGVMRIIGEWTPPPGTAKKFATEAQAAIERARLGVDDALTETEGTSEGENLRATVTAIRAAFAKTQPVANLMGSNAKRSGWMQLSLPTRRAK